MGQLGPRKTPTVLRILKGNTRKENLTAMAAAEPKSPASNVDPPDDLEGLALEKWNESVPMLSTMRVWGKSERETWARYCRLHQLWHECYTIVRKEGQVYVKASGMLSARPETSLLIQYGTQLIRLECEFGLTPASRSGATVHEVESDPMADFLREAQ